MNLKLDTSVQYIPRVGPVMAKRLEKLEIRTVRDFLWHVPFRYDDFSQKLPISRTQIEKTVTIEGNVDRISMGVTKTGKKLVTAKITDASGSIEAVWFNQPFLLNMIHKGDTVRLSGKISWFGTKKVIESPVYEIVGEHKEASLHTGRLVPIYAETEGVSSKWMRGRVKYMLDTCIQEVFEYIPDTIIKKYRLPEEKNALIQIHFPDTLSLASSARRRLAFDELFLLQVTSFEQKRLWQTKKAPPIGIDGPEIKKFTSSLPFTLTNDQEHAIEEILSDLSKPVPMNRLLVGDVGSGKTVVAALAMFAAYKNGNQTLLMAPTQILAEQHYATIQKLFAPVGIGVGLVTANKKEMNNAILIGTHALLNQKLSTVGLVVVDEQQRFGVEQRSELMSEKSGQTPHLLTMTATPIPRTVARAMIGNVDLSVLETMPKGRQKIKTWVVPKQKRNRAYEWIEKTLKDTGGQAFIICPLIEESETITSVRAVKTEFEHLKKIFPAFQLGLVHGRLKPEEKTRALDEFHKGKTDILVATPVVEVGIDVPNAVIMMIEGSERFGLAQLHQLRGRVGRGKLQSYCLLFTESDETGTTARLKSLETTFSGPKLAEIDLKLRGPGELFGTRQHGMPGFKIASFADTSLIEDAQQAAKDVASLSPDLSLFPQLSKQVKSGIIGVHD